MILWNCVFLLSHLFSRLKNASASSVLFSILPVMLCIFSSSSSSVFHVAMQIIKIICTFLTAQWRCAASQIHRYRPRIYCLAYSRAAPRNIWKIQAKLLGWEAILSKQTSPKPWVFLKQRIHNKTSTCSDSVQRKKRIIACVQCCSRFVVSTVQSKAQHWFGWTSTLWPAGGKF